LEVKPSIARPIDTGYFADPARQRESLVQNNQSLKPQASSDAADSLHQKEVEVFSETERPPSLLCLLKLKSITAVVTYYPNLICRNEFAILFLVFLNVVRKYGFKYPLGLAIEYIGWKLNALFRIKSQGPTSGNISLRKMLREFVYPEILGDNPVAVLLRKGR
jgi:hypothetical protein